MNTKRYWLRGGLIFTAVYLIFALIVYIMIISTPAQNCTPGVVTCGLETLKWYLLIASPLLLVRLIPFVGSFLIEGFNALFQVIFLTPSGDSNLVVIILVNVVIVFLLGALLGWIYGKIKNRNK